MVFHLISNFLSTLEAEYTEQISVTSLILIKIVQSLSSWSWRALAKVVQQYSGYLFCPKNVSRDFFRVAFIFPLDF